MKLGQTSILAALVVIAGQLAVSGPAAEAFQETPGVSLDTSGKINPVTTSGLSGPLPSVRTQGQEIRVPGLGTIGVLPKLDFGLELLYGTNNQSSGPGDDKSEQGAQIRGTLKYRFPN